ncbi:hypothetical protein PVAND_003077 [Polypedilum vanderplanki]|uniref:Ionotropic receptor n=1 Tax=Polypedilum vanderplanki TaxID=319348 RepID=A0A9J6BSZ5_POLVA|nr:hypothetical protein PVAND_003077 [Polypedilum vanderplanki]
MIKSIRSINLMAYLLFSENKCQIFIPKLINYMYIDSQICDYELENFEHFSNFYGCMVNFVLLCGPEFYTNIMRTNIEALQEYNLIEWNQNDTISKTQGLTSELIRLMEEKFNFTIHYSITKQRNYEMKIFYSSKNFAPNENNAIYFGLNVLQPMPRVLLVITFGLTFLTIFVLHRCPKWIRITFFGTGIKKPGYNALGIFFGISQLRLPHKNFCRIILILFIWFCLIFRTCYQSKMFEFLTSDMQRPLPQTIDDLRTMNYTIIITQYFEERYINDEIINRRKPPKIEILTDNEYIFLYKDAIQGKVKEKYAFLICDAKHKANAKYNDSLAILKTEKTSRTRIFGTTMPLISSLWLAGWLAGWLVRDEISKTTIARDSPDQLIPTGIVNHLLDYGMWYLNRPRDPEIIDPRNILSMNDLEFGYFYIENNIHFDLIIYGKTTKHIDDVVNLVTKNISEIIPIKVIHIENILKYRHEFNQSAIVFTKHSDIWEHLQIKSSNFIAGQPMLKNLVPKKFKFLIYIENYKEININRGNTLKSNKLNILNLSDLRFFTFLMIKNFFTVELRANNIFSKIKCQEFRLERINYMYIDSRQWDQTLENYDHFVNFHGCMIPFAIPMGTDFYTSIMRIKIVFLEKYNLIEWNQNETINKAQGLTRELLNLMAAKLNFTIHYTILGKNQIFFNLKNFNPSVNNAISLSIRTQLPMENDHMLVHYSTVVKSTEYYYLVTSNDLYNNYEKLLFPFDLTTWVLLVITFGLTFLTIFVLHRCPKWIRITFFGTGIKKPGYNALGIFFGISQLRLPHENFCRVILILFIWFCLIFRTCYQSKMFEFLTSDMRRPLPQTIDDLRIMNYTIVLLKYSDFTYINDEIINGRESPKILKLIIEDFNNLYIDSVRGHIKEKFAFFLNNDIHSMYNTRVEDSLALMKNEKITKPTAYKALSNNIFLLHLNYFLDQLIPTGIVNHLLDYGMWYLNRPRDPEIIDPRKILSMNDLEFGFVIWLMACFLSFLAFLYEIISLNFKRKFKMLIGLIDFLRVLRVRMADYHDKW